MTTQVTSFELAPAGTAIPTSGVAGDGDAYHDTGLSSGTSYSYRVRSVG